MTDWDRVRRDLRAAGYPGFERESGESAVPGLAGGWVVGDVPREGDLRRDRQSLPVRILDALPGGSAVGADPDRAPEPLRRIADDHGLSVVVVSVAPERARVALCSAPDRTGSP